MMGEIVFISFCTRSSKTFSASLRTLSITLTVLTPLSHAVNCPFRSLILSLKNIFSAAKISPFGISSPPQIHDALACDMMSFPKAKGLKMWINDTSLFFNLRAISVCARMAKGMFFAASC